MSRSATFSQLDPDIPVGIDHKGEREIMSYASIRLFCATVIFCLVSLTHAQEGTKLLPVRVDGAWGFINREGKLAVSPQFAFASSFSEGLAAVSRSTTGPSCGYIDESGAVVIPFNYDFCGPFRSGLAEIKSSDNKKYGYIDQKGNLAIAASWDLAWSFSDGLARVSKGKFDTERYGFIDRSGKVVIKPSFVFAGDFNQGLAPAAVDTGNGLKLGFIDQKGKWVVKPKYGSVNRFSEGFACVVQEGTSYVVDGQLALQTDDDEELKGFYIDKHGRRAFKLAFEHCGDFMNGLAPVQVDGKWAFIDRKGSVVIQTRFPAEAQVSPFFEGVAAINFAGKTQYVNMKGNIELETEFDWGGDFVDQIARVKTVTSNGRESFGYIDRHGRVIWRPSS